MNIGMKILFVLKALWAMIFPSYTVDFDVSLLPQQFIYREIPPKVEPRQIAVSVESNAYKDLRELLINEQHGWRYDLAAYGGLKVFAADTMRINCYDGGLVINYADRSGNWVQIVKAIPGKACPSPFAKEVHVIIIHRRTLCL